MDRTKKQKLDRQLKQSLKTVTALKPTLITPQQQSTNDLLTKIFPPISQLNSLRILTVLEITYLLEVYLELLDKHNSELIREFKIGIIGGGIMGRLVLNSILPFSKDGLQLSNVTVSTRQTDNFKVYIQNFGVNCHFDNETIAKESDFLIVTTPATLDNWIIADLRDPLKERVLSNEKKPNNSLTSIVAKLTTQKSYKSSVAKSEDKKKNTQQKEIAKVAETRNFPFKPLVYIMTSDFYQEKAKKFFKFPVLTPSIRAKDIPSIKQTLEIFSSQTPQSLQAHQKILAWWLLKQKVVEPQRLESANSQMLKDMLPEQQEIFGQKYRNTYLYNILKVLSFVSDYTPPASSINSSLSNTINLSQKDKKKEEFLLSQVLQVVTSNGEVDETLFKKIRKWSMAHNNFIA